MATTKRWDQLRMTEEDWRILRGDIETYFTPGRPIKEQDLILGRRDQIQRLVDCARIPGLHAVVHGERGVGKSSIGNTFHYFISGDRRRVQYVRVQATASDTFSSLWMKVFKRLGSNGSRVSEKYASKTITEDCVLLELESFSAAHLPIIVIDELDRLTNKGAKIALSDTIKTLSDDAIAATIVFIGVAETVDQLIEDHASVERALRQVEVKRMAGREIRDIVQKGITRVGMLIAKNALERIVFISKGLPYYAHLLGLHASQGACDHRSTVVELRDVETGITRALVDVGHTTRDGYEKAIYSERSDAIFQEVLLACCLAERDAVGRFTAKGVAEHLFSIIGHRLEVPQFSYHLNEFCGPKRGGVLQKLGNKRNFKYRFQDALMEPFVIAQSIEKRVIGEEILRKIIPRQVPDLFSI